MASTYDVSQQELVTQLAEELKKINEIKAPEWAPFVKTGVSKERPPQKPDWWYIRAASILNKVYKKGPIGTNKLRTLYGGNLNRGVRPEHFYKGSGSIIRKVLQQLEKAGLIKQDKHGHHKGRVVTPKGESLVDKVATKIAGPRKKAAPKVVSTPTTEVKSEKLDIKKAVKKEEAKKVEEKKKEEKVETKKIAKVTETKVPTAETKPSDTKTEVGKVETKRVEKKEEKDVVTTEKI